MKRVVLAAATLFTAALAADDASAYVNICNQTSTGLWSTYAYYIANPSKISDGCGYSGLDGDCGYSYTWRSEGWWRIEAGACATVYGSAITNRYSYFQVVTDDGRYINDGPAFWVDEWNAFTRDQYTSAPWYGNGECIGTIGHGSCIPQYWYQVGHRIQDTGSSKNFIINVTN